MLDLPLLAPAPQAAPPPSVGRTLLRAARLHDVRSERFAVVVER